MLELENVVGEWFGDVRAHRERSGESIFFEMTRFSS
jgi:hypothetical protein